MSILTSLEDLGAATCKLSKFCRQESPKSKVLQKSFGSPAEVQYSCSKCDIHTYINTYIWTDIWTSMAAVTAKNEETFISREKTS